MTEPESQRSVEEAGGSDQQRDAAVEPAVSEAAATGDAGEGEERAPLFPNDEEARFRRRWEELQTGFVDQPRQVVAEADDLVGELMQQLTAGFDQERTSLEAQWENGDDVSTEELRVALRHYRSFFNRLLSA